MVVVVVKVDSLRFSSVVSPELSSGLLVDFTLPQVKWD